MSSNPSGSYSVAASSSAGVPEPRGEENDVKIPLEMLSFCVMSGCKSLCLSPTDAGGSLYDDGRGRYVCIHQNATGSHLIARSFVVAVCF